MTILLAAYNEEAVISRTLNSLRGSTYPVLEFLVVDDGSKDDTAREVRALSLLDDRVRLIRQKNTGKAGALNNGLQAASGEIIVTVDADTIVAPDTVSNLVRHFAADVNGFLGAVAGVVRVGNRSANLITRWQSLEYVCQISVERAAQDALGAISIVPGACAAWRKDAILSAGGYSEDTLAEDCDLSLTLHRLGWRVTQDDSAFAYTEAPATADDILKQRVRWTFGIMQAIIKNKDMLFDRRYGWLGTSRTALVCLVAPPSSVEYPLRLRNGARSLSHTGLGDHPALLPRLHYSAYGRCGRGAAPRGRGLATACGRARVPFDLRASSYLSPVCVRTEGSSGSEDGLE